MRSTFRPRRDIYLLRQYFTIWYNSCLFLAYCLQIRYINENNCLVCFVSYHSKGMILQIVFIQQNNDVVISKSTTTNAIRFTFSFISLVNQLVYILPTMNLIVAVVIWDCLSGWQRLQYCFL